MFKQFSGGWALRGVLGETLGYEVFELWGPLGLNRRRRFLNNVEDHAALRLVDVWWIAVRHLRCKDAKGPDVHFGRVFALSPNELRSHPAYSTHFGRPPLLLLRELHSVAEVSQFDFSLGVH